MIVRCELPRSDLTLEEAARDMMDYAVGQAEYQNQAFSGYWYNPHNNDGGAIYIVINKEHEFQLVWFDEAKRWYSIPRKDTLLPVDEYEMNPVWITPELLVMYVIHGIAGAVRIRMGL